MFLLLGVLIASALAVVAIRWCMRHGVWIPIGKGIWIRRWYAPVNESEDTLLEIQSNINNVCLSSIDTLLNYPIMQAKTVDDFKRAVKNKFILEAYNAKEDQVVAFHIGFWTELNVHLGLVMVKKSMQGRGLQQLSLLNLFFLLFDWGAVRFRLSDIGYSSSAFRLMSEHIYQSYPNLYYRVQPRQWHLDIAQLLLKKYRTDMGISLDATFDSTHFIVKGSNASSGGGAHQLVQFHSTRKSRSSIAAQYLDDLMTPEDEQLYIGEANLFYFVWQGLPLLRNVIKMIRWATVFVIFTIHNYVYANASWYTPTVLKLMYFKHVIRGKVPTKPCLWVCNHYSYLDALTVHAALPGVRIIAKKDLADEMPKGFFREFMYRLWTRGGFVWFDRVNGDDTIRERVSEILKSGQSVLVFSEGTSRRSGPPQPMRRGALRIAKENNVPIQPVAIRYSMPIGLAVGDNAVKNAMSIYKMRNIVAGINFGDQMQVGSDLNDMEPIRDQVHQLWQELEPDMVHINPEIDVKFE